MIERLELYLDYASIGNAHEWEDIVCQAVDDLAEARRECVFMGRERRFYYIGRDRERGMLWTGGRYILGNPDTGARALRSGGSEKSRKRLTGSSGWTKGQGQADGSCGKRPRTS